MPDEARRERTLLPLLFRAARAMNDETVARLQARGHADCQPSYPRLLGSLDESGTRIGVLARRLGTSRQAVSQLLQEVEERGYVSRRPDPDDKRGVVVVLTARGRRLYTAAAKAMGELETEWSSVLGEAGLARLGELLGRLVDGLPESRAND
jgi:DNA-binding MarR family transcriptional regulator